MSEQTIQNDLYSNPVSILDKYTCYSLGATTVRDLVAQKVLEGVPLTVNLGKKPDVLIVDKDKHVVVFLEFKVPSELDSAKKIEKAVKQEIHVARDVSAKIYVVSDGTSFYWYNPYTENRIKDENGNEICTEIKPKKEELKLADFINRVALTISATNDCLLKTVDCDPTNLAMKIGGILKNISFATPKDSLYTFVELFLFKYLSDIGILKGDDSFNAIYTSYNKVTEEEVLYKYLYGPRETINVLFPVAPDKTTIINGTIFHAFKDSKGMYRCNGTDAKTFHAILKLFYEYEKANGPFLNISRDFKSKLFETFTKQEKSKQNAGKYFTPLKIVQGMVNMVDIKEGMSICDPACGVGKFLLEASMKIDSPFSLQGGVVTKRLDLIGFEKEMDEKGATSGYDLTTILAKANTLIYYSNLFKDNNNITDIQTLSQELLNKMFVSSKTICGTLDNLDENKYDLILANPPYYQSAIITSEAKSKGYYSEGGSGVEGLFLEWIVKSLKKGGTANIVLPDGIFNNLANQKLRDYIIKTCFVEAIISLPLNTFFNTPKKTFVLTIIKKENVNDTQKHPVFAYLCNSIGESLDVNRFDIDDNDFGEAVSKYVHYHKADDKTQLPRFLADAYAQDGKLKFLPISSFKTGDDWFIDNRWTDEEKVQLGFKEQANAMTVSEMQSFIDTVCDEMAS
ncbi:MAG: N-6 DNA methylase [Firmicutes bacterium]|nr:N-6 DNA methylase [Bacillota bacterium]